MNSKYESGDIHHLVVDVIADWDEWIADPRSRVRLVTDAIEGVQEDYRKLLYPIFRQQVDYTGSAHASAFSLYNNIDRFHRISLDGFLDSLMGIFQGRLNENEPNDKRLSEEVEQIRAKYQ